MSIVLLGLVRLWDMFNFNVIGLIHLLWMLDFHEKATLTPKPQATPFAGLGGVGLLGKLPLSDPPRNPEIEELSDLDKLNARDILDAAGKLADALNLRSTKHRVSEFELKLRFFITGGAYKNEIKVLREALKFDLSECKFYHYPNDKAEILVKSFAEWNRIRKAFPEAANEALIAYDCYALQHNTACVFHIMRVAEHGLRALAKERRVRLAKNKPVDWATWQEIITQLNAEATKIGQKASAGQKKDDALSFYSGALADLNAFKDEYRNQVMHVRKDYDHVQALRALGKVQGFMDRLSEKMNHTHSRIKWGLKFKGS